MTGRTPFANLIKDMPVDRQARIAAKSAELEAAITGQRTEVTAFTIYRDGAHRWRWRLVAANREIIAQSPGSFETQQQCEAAIDLLHRSVDAPVVVSG